MGPRYWAKLSAQLWIGLVDAICRDRARAGSAGNGESDDPEPTACMNRRHGHAICISFGWQRSLGWRLTRPVPYFDPFDPREYR